MTYFRVNFMTPGIAGRAKIFRTEESARKHAVRVLGLFDESSLDSKVTIVAESKSGSTIERPERRGSV